MYSQNENNEVLSFLDLLDLDEEIIDTRLKSVMVRRNHSNTDLKCAIQLLQYKMLINTQDGTDCDNNAELAFTAELLQNVNTENVDYVCKILNIVLCLNTSSIIYTSEHIIQQILLNVDYQTDKSNVIVLEEETCTQTMINLKVCGSVLDAVIKNKERLSLLFLETPLENILDSTDDKLKYYFLTNIVPKLFEGVTGYNILDRIWNYVTQIKEDQTEKALKIISCLSDYYLPTQDVSGYIKYESEIVLLAEFWNIILLGINSHDPSVTKISVYLLKRAIDCVIVLKKDIILVEGFHVTFGWDKNKAEYLKQVWGNYFILLDSLEEKQSNIVLPSLKFFETIDIADCWLNAAYNIGLRHDNNQVKFKCIEYKFKAKVVNIQEACTLLEALNDTNINYEMIKAGFNNLLEDYPSLMKIIQAIPHIKWSPVPLYFLTQTLSNLEFKAPFNDGNVVTTILKIQCNNIVIRKAIIMNVIMFVSNCCENLNWKDIVNMGSVLPLDTQTCKLLMLLDHVVLKDEETYDFLKELSNNIRNTDFIQSYLCKNTEKVNIFTEVINKKINTLNDVISRQYANKRECLDDVIYLVHFFSKTSNVKGNFNKIIPQQNKNIMLYFLSLFSSDADLTIEEVAMLFDTYIFDIGDKDLEEKLLQLYKTSILFLKEKSEIDKAVLSIFAIKMLIKQHAFIKKYNHEICDLKSFIKIMSDVEFKDTQDESVGRLKNAFFEKSCEVIYLRLKFEIIRQPCLEELINYIEYVLECGGYGCLKWILKIVNLITNALVNDKSKFNIVQFIKRVWNEIEELKSNNQYSQCIEGFVELITQDAILEKVLYNNVVMLYCNKIIEYGPVKTNPLYYLTRKLYEKGVKHYGHLVCVLCEILLYCPVSRKDQRIADNVTLHILKDSTYEIDKDSLDIHFNFEIQYLSIATLCNINDGETLDIIARFVTNKIGEMVRNKQRYHGNSHTHRILLSALQHLLIIVLKSVNVDWLLNWCFELLVKLPHQPSVRICLEWLVALHYYVKKQPLNENLLQTFKSKQVPLTSQFFIIYWILKRKIYSNTYNEDEYNYVLDFLLSNTMGQLFNVRLHAQYLATVLNNIAEKTTKFDYTIAIIEKTFKESVTDKNYVKLESDYFGNAFDIIADFNPFFIYYLLPKYCDVDIENVDLDFIKTIIKKVSLNLLVDDSPFKTEWRSFRRNDEEYPLWKPFKGDAKIALEDNEAMGTIQKKYIPWKNMTDIDTYDAGKKAGSSELIVVASLIDKLPNLGGMARTSEVFGVKTYVVDSLRHLQDKQFQGLSVSAERWINIEEVRPGRPLKDYLMQKKTEGYSVVAAEQTSTSSKLQDFKFPKKTLLLLGHEKEGVPCDLLPIMDHCVEIPQQGYVRSLNVHVTAAIFVWEYARQNVL